METIHEPIQHCPQSITVYFDSPNGTVKTTRSCVLEFHTAVDDRGKVIHQDSDGRRWS